MDLTQKYLKSILHYNIDTGLFIRKVSRGGNAVKGRVAGYKDVYGYIVIQINEKRYKAHRLAWFYMEGYWPEYQVDHINRVKSDNRWCNLRHITPSCNNKNRNVSKISKSGVTGVIRERNKWRVRIKTPDSYKHIGCFDDLDEAVRARWVAEKKYNYPDCNETSSAYIYLSK